MQEEEIALRKEAREAQEQLQAAAVLQKNAQENGQTLPEETTKQPIAVQVREAPESSKEVQEPLAGSLPMHKNGSNGVALGAEIRMVAAGTIIPHVNKVPKASLASLKDKDLGVVWWRRCVFCESYWLWGHGSGRWCRQLVTRWRRSFTLLQ